MTASRKMPPYSSSRGKTAGWGVNVKEVMQLSHLLQVEAC
ncbi:hypothetical protein COXBURSA331_A1507 [Coxiella burnetii RSA 331]|nr:hypothetical protein COXBURSA331_A1507 [Coxiella burnetii RSA 331]